MKKTCGLDVHKDTVFCAVFDGKKHGEVKQYSTVTPSLYSMGENLQLEGVKKIAIESTGSYWIPVWNILEEMGFELILVNPYLIKQMPGRKSDVKDAQWIATLLHKGMLRSSLVPDKTIRELRVYSRQYVKLQQKRTSILQSIERNLEMCGIRITSYVSNISGKSVQRVVEQVIDDISDPEELIESIHGRIVNKHTAEVIKASLTGFVTPNIVLYYNYYMKISN
jgi:transposase